MSRGDPPDHDLILSLPRVHIFQPVCHQVAVESILRAQANGRTVSRICYLAGLAVDALLVETVDIRLHLGEEGVLTRLTTSRLEYVD